MRLGEKKENVAKMKMRLGEKKENVAKSRLGGKKRKCSELKAFARLHGPDGMGTSARKMHGLAGYCMPRMACAKLHGCAPGHDNARERERVRVRRNAGLRARMRAGPV